MILQPELGLLLIFNISAQFTTGVSVILHSSAASKGSARTHLTDSGSDQDIRSVSSRVAVTVSAWHSVRAT